MKNKLCKRVNLFFSSFFIFLLHLPFVFAKSKAGTSGEVKPAVIAVAKTSASSTPPIEITNNNVVTNLYDSLRLNTLGLAKNVFEYAMAGFNSMKEMGTLMNTSIISIADFSKPSSKKRLFVIDLKNCKVLFNTYVAHGMNSGREFANQFSNTPESNKSSLGFYSTLNTYEGKHGYSLHLQGVERGINDNAYRRDIVMHAADYVSESFINNQGYLGRSQGCPAIPERLHKPIIDKIKNGTCFFIFGQDKRYLTRSRLLSGLHA
ncbi:MAG: murein L,D-transpeptidase catalytic domain family protein [Ferruginibacter sp.]